MHIKNNMFDNISNTVMNVKGKRKDNMKVRMNLALYYDGWKMKLFDNRLYVAKPKPYLSYIRMYYFFFNP